MDLAKEFFQPLCDAVEAHDKDIFENVPKAMTESETAQLVSIITAGATVVAYIIGEGMVDANNKE